MLLTKNPTTFLTLPHELGDLIYALLLCGKTFIRSHKVSTSYILATDDDTSRDVWSKAGSIGSSGLDNRDGLEITRTSKVVKKEATEAFYEEASFRFSLCHTSSLSRTYECFPDYGILDRMRYIEFCVNIGEGERLGRSMWEMREVIDGYYAEFVTRTGRSGNQRRCFSMVLEGLDGLYCGEYDSIHEAPWFQVTKALSGHGMVTLKLTDRRDLLAGLKWGMKHEPLREEIRKELEPALGVSHFSKEARALCCFSTKKEFGWVGSW